jgi:hypothetical protein
MRNRNTSTIRAGILRNPFLYPVALATSVLLSACAGPPTSQAQNPKPPKQEYMVYRIDDHRYITIESRYPCINGQIDGKIYYYDTRQNIRTAVAYTGDADNGLYRGYYAIHADSSYVAIPSLSFSQTSGMKLHINYSRDGGQTFQWFTVGDAGENYAVILDNNLLYITKNRLEDHSDPQSSWAQRYNIEQDMESEMARHDPGATIKRYGKFIFRQQVPLNIKSPSGSTQWSCPKFPIN